MDLTDKADLAELGDLIGCAKAAAPDVDWLLVGATSRDLLLRYGYGIHVSRRTADVDLALAVENWESFDNVRKRLLDSSSFTARSGVVHQLQFRHAIPLDIVAFGGVEQHDRTIAWPPEGTTKMTVTGFQEAMRTAVTVRLPGNISVAVVNLPMLVLLKLFAWVDRKHTRPGVDAFDILLVLSNYLACGNQTRLFDEHSDLVDAPDFDYELTGAQLAGRDLKAMLAAVSPQATSIISELTALVQTQVSNQQPGLLLQQAPTNRIEQFADLLQRFVAGLSEK